MTPEKHFHFIIIDDSPFDCLIAEKVVENAQCYQSIKTFQDAEKALAYIAAGGNQDNSGRCIILLDIQMPVMNGFAFLDAFETLPDEITSKYVVFFATSSINSNDITRSNNYRSVRHFLNKPLTKVNFKELVEQLEF